MLELERKYYLYMYITMIVIFYLGKQKLDIIAITEKSGYMFIG